MRKNVISKEKIFYLISIMAAVSFVIGSLAIGISYYVSFEQQRLRLIETAQSQARLIEAVAKFDNQFSAQDHPAGAFGATLSQIIKAHKKHKGFGETGEFVLAKREGNQIVFLFSHRFLDRNTPKPVPFDSHIAEPMRLALKGESGSIEGLDYRGETVLAAYEPVNWSNHKIGIVAKVDISEIRKPFIIAGLVTGLLAMIILGFGVFIFTRLTRPFVAPDSEIFIKKETGYHWLIAGPVFMAAVILYVDTSIPLGVACGVPYVALFLFSILSPTRFFIISIGILGTLTTVIGFFLSPENGLLWMALVNRFLAIFAIWITAVLTLYHKETEIKALESARSLEKSQEIAHIGSFDWNIKTNELSWTEEHYKIFGRNPKEFEPTYEAFLDAIHPDDREIVKQAVEESINNDATYNIEYRIVRPDNEERFVHDRAIVYRDYLGKPLHMLGAAHDITKRKKAEEALRESEERLRKLSETAFEGMVITENGNIIECNGTFAALFGYTRDELMGVSVIDLTAPEDIETVSKNITKGHEGVYEITGLRKDGSTFPIEAHGIAAPYQGRMARITAIRDISARKRAEESLSASEQKFRALTQSASDAIITSDSKGNIVTWNSAAETIFGYSDNETLSQNIIVLIPERYQKQHSSAFEMASSKGELKNDGGVIEVEGVKKDGSKFPMELSLSGWKMGKDLFFTAIIRDITERRLVERELAEYQNHLEQLVDNRTAEIKLIQKIAVASNEASTVDEAMRTCLAQVCGYTRWEIGHVYTPDGEGVCSPTDLWYVKNPERFDAFLEITMKTTFPPGVGLPGRVYKSGEPVWIKDVTKDTNFPRMKTAGKIGMKAGFAFPVMEGENVISILEFFTTIAVEPDQFLLDTVKNLATQIGRLTERKRIEKELLLKNYAIDSSIEAMMMANLDSDITYTNQKMCELWGYGEKELLGCNTSILRAEECLKGTIQKILREKGEYEGEFLAIRKDGATFIAHVSTFTVKDESGNTITNMSSFVDVTERIRNEEALRESSRQLEESQRVANLGTYTLDISSGTRSTSNIHDRIYGISNPKYILDVERWLKAIHPAQREEIQSYFTHHVLAKHNRFDKEYRIIRLNDEQERWVHDVGELILDDAGRPVKMIGTVQDITEQKRTEKALVAAKDEAEAATKLKDKFILLASHDLRSPLSSITGFLNFIKSDTKNPLCREHRDIADRMIQIVGHQLNMIDGLLDLTRLQTGNILLKHRFINASLIGENIVQNMLSVAEDKDIKLINDIPDNTRLYADMALFSEVIVNLVSNAIKFCSKEDSIKLFAPDDEKPIIAVSDTGAGIDSGILSRLFTQEYKTSTVGTAGEKGAGLGLPYSHEIMRAHGGKLYAESTIGAGTVFFAELPYVKPQMLIVDNDKAVRDLIRSYVDPLDVYIKEAVNEHEAIGMLKHFTPHLVITDINMPALDGLQLLERIRNNPALKSVPVIVMTLTDVNLRAKAFQMQASDFIIKPLSADEFIPRVRRFIG